MSFVQQRKLSTSRTENNEKKECERQAEIFVCRFDSESFEGSLRFFLSVRVGACLNPTIFVTV